MIMNNCIIKKVRVRVAGDREPSMTGLDNLCMKPHGTCTMLGRHNHEPRVTERR
jgi:hypothetical protein